jgi:cytochrome P450
MTYPNPLSNSIRWFTDPYAFLDEAHARHGLTFRMALPGMGNALLTGEPELIRAIVAEKSLVGGKGINVMRALFGGESTIMLHGEIHRARRRLLMPFFHYPDLARYDDLTVQATLAALQQIPYDRPFSLFDYIRRITQTVIVRVVFGELAPDQEVAALELVHAYMTSFHNPLVLFLKPLRLDFGPRSPWGRFVRNRQRLREFIAGQLRTFQPRPENAASALAHILSQGDLTEDDAITEIFSLLMFGHDTTAVTIAWAFAHLYSHPEAVARLKVEPFSGARLDADTPTFLQACINESMRLAPAVVQLFRVAEEDVRLDGHIVRKGEMVMPCLYLAHRNPQVFPEPERFLPERFLGENFPAHAFFPFGFGVRLCLGKALAQRQMPLIVSTIVQNAELSLAPGYVPAPVRYMVLIAPRQGTLMVRVARD